MRRALIVSGCTALALIGLPAAANADQDTNCPSPLSALVCATVGLQVNPSFGPFTFGPFDIGSIFGKP